MSSLITEDEISHETELVWLEDIDTLDYVRQSLDRLPTRRAATGRNAVRRSPKALAHLGKIITASQALRRQSGARSALAPVQRPWMRSWRHGLPRTFTGPATS